MPVPLSHPTPALTVRLQPSPDAPRGLLVLLHGLGADENDLLGLAPALPPDLAYAAVRPPAPRLGGLLLVSSGVPGRV